MRVFLTACAIGLVILVSQALGGFSLPDGISNVTKLGGGNASIYYKAKAYDDDEYEWAGGHPPKGYKKGHGLDCSGLVNVAVLKAKGVDEDQNSDTYKNSKHWKRIKFTQAKIGDILYRITRPNRVGHVAIVVSNKGDGKLTVFEALTEYPASGKEKDEILHSYHQSYSRFDGALTFVK